MQAGIRRSLRWCATAAARHTLYPVNGKVVAFAVDDAAMANVGLRSGDRVRSYAGNRVGQLGVVVGMRNSALFIKWGDDTRVQGHALRDLPRLDIRYIDHLGISGLDHDEYKEGDRYSQPLFTMKEAEAKGRISMELDDASVQHLVNEKPCEEPCHRCMERSNWLAIENAVEGVGLALHTRTRVLRLLRLESDVLGKMSSKELVDRAIQVKMESDAKNADMLQAAKGVDEVLAELIEARIQAFDALHKVRIGGDDHLVPTALVKPHTNYTLRHNQWVSSLVPERSAYGNTFRKVAEKRINADLGIPLYDAAARILDAVSPSSTLEDHIEAAGVSATGTRWLQAAMMLDCGGFTAMHNVVAALDTSTDSDRARALAGMLKTRLDQLAANIVVEDENGKRLTVPREALEEEVSKKCTIADGAWARAVMDSSRHLSAQRQGEEEAEEVSILGREGEIVSKKPTLPPGLDAKDTATKLLYQLSIFRGRHMEPQIPRADVYCPDGDYKYLDRACAVELYAKAENPPQMFCAKGMIEYKHNAWHQPMNMVNEHGLEQWARQVIRGRRNNSRRTVYPHNFPGASML